MTPKEHELILLLATRGGDPEKFLLEFRGGSDPRVVKLLLEEALASEDADDVECALIVGFVVGFRRDDVGILLALLRESWHYKHEDIVSALAGLSAKEAIDGLYQATQWTPDYLDYDESRALAVKAIWALGQINDERAFATLDRLRLDSNSVVANAAAEQVERRTGSVTD